MNPWWRASGGDLDESGEFQKLKPLCALVILTIFSGGDVDLQKAKENIALFDIIIIAEKNMDLLNSLGWYKESDTTHPTYGDYKRAAILLVKLRFIRLINYIRKKKFVPSEDLKIEEQNKLDLELYHELKNKISD